MCTTVIVSVAVDKKKLCLYNVVVYLSTVVKFIFVADPEVLKGGRIEMKMDTFFR